MPKSCMSRHNLNNLSMKTLIYSFSMLLLMSFCAISCNNSDDSYIEEPAETNVLADRLSQGIVEIMQNKDSQFNGNGYVVYDATSDSVFTCTEFIHDVIEGIYAHSDNETTTSNTIRKTPTGKGWTFGGSCKGKVGALSLAAKIAKQIPEKTNFELHVEVQDDGSYNVWYRIVP